MMEIKKYLSYDSFFLLNDICYHDIVRNIIKLPPWKQHIFQSYLKKVLLSAVRLHVYTLYNNMICDTWSGSSSGGIFPNHIQKVIPSNLLETISLFESNTFTPIQNNQIILYQLDFLGNFQHHIFTSTGNMYNKVDTG